MHLHDAEEDKLIGTIREFAENKQHDIDEKNMSRQMIAHQQISIDDLINESVESHSEQDEIAYSSESDFTPTENSESEDGQIYADSQEEGINNEENTGN